MTCIHIWQIATAEGPTSLGVCSRCGEEREHKNFIPIPERTNNAARRKLTNAMAQGKKNWTANRIGLPFSMEP